MIHMRIFCVSLCFNVFHVSAYLESGHRLHGSVYKTFYKLGKQDCIKECVHRTSCKSFNFDESNHICEISYVNKSQVSVDAFQTNSDYEYGDKHNFISSADEQCQDVMCPEKQKCVVLHNSRTVCAITECGEPQVIPKTFIPEYTNISVVGQIYNYQCESGYLLEGNATTYCKANGEWSTASVQCKDCGVTPNATNAEVIPGNLTIGSVVYYACIDQFTMNGGVANITCQSNGQWSEPTIVCLPAATCDTGNGFTYNVGLQICYKIVTASLTWKASSETCQSEGGQLMKLHTEQLRAHIKSLLPSNKYHHIGAHDIGHTSVFTWMDGTPVTGVPWEGTEPDSNKNINGLDIVIKQGNLYFYDDGYDTYSNSYICEIVLA